MVSTTAAELENSRIPGTSRTPLWTMDLTMVTGSERATRGNGKASVDGDGGGRALKREAGFR